MKCWKSLRGGGGGLNIYFYLLFVGFVLCLSFLVLVGGLDWSLCLTHGRHVSLDVFFWFIGS